MHTNQGRWLGAAVVVAVVAGEARAGDSAAKELRSKDIVVRLAVVHTAVREGGKDAEAILVQALGNDDWEVVEAAAAGLATRGTKPTAVKLVRVALDGPVRRVRLAAARSAAKLDVARTVQILESAAAGPDAVRAYEALAAIGEAGPNAPAAALVDRGLDVGRRPAEKAGTRGQDAVRAAAASALGAFGRADRRDRLTRLVGDESAAVACAALEASAAAPDVALLGTLLALPAADGERECVERRVRAAVRAAVAGRPRGSDAALAAKPVFDALAAASSPEEARRFVRIVAALAEPSASEPADESLVAAAVTALASAAEKPGAGVRSAAAAALGRIRSPLAGAALVRLAGDADAHVRLVAVPALAACAKPRDAAAVAAFVSRLSDPDVAVREAAAVALGVEGAAEAVSPLKKALADAVTDPANPDWALASAALVSLGKTRDSLAVEPMTVVFRASPDWRVRASAVAGLARVRQKDAVPVLIEALGDKSASVRATALASLAELGGRDVRGGDAKAWRTWWDEKSKTFFFADHRAALRDSRMYGWSETAAGVYEDLDVVLMSGPGGDDARGVLDLQGIRYRTVKTGQLAAAGVHPDSLVLGFADDASGADAEVVEWFVRAGGLLAAGPQRLESVLLRRAPGCVGVAAGETTGALVPVTPCAPWSKSVDGVFADAKPLRRGEPRTFVRVLDPDRVEVAIDSPPAAAASGSADFACWLRVGHGTAVELGGGLDVAGEAWFAGSRSADDRAAVAIDRMGLTYAEVRKLREKKVFDTAAKCAAEVVDLSSFRFVTNFVREKRRAE